MPITDQKLSTSSFSYPASDEKETPSRIRRAVSTGETRLSTQKRRFVGLLPPCAQGHGNIGDQNSSTSDRGATIADLKVSTSSVKVRLSDQKVSTFSLAARLS